MNFEQIAKPALPHLAAIIVMLVVIFAFFTPLFEGKIIQQSDVIQWKGMSKEIREYREKTGKEALWTNAMFSGMPAYQISMWTLDNLTNRVRGAMQKVMPEPANLMLFAMLSAYLLFCVMGVGSWLALIGAIAYGFSTYNILIIDAGHVTKFSAMAYMPAVIAGVLMAYKGKYFTGSAIAGLAMAFNVGSNHYQITYYMLLLLAIYFFMELVNAIRQHTLPNFAKATAMLGLMFVLAFASDTTRLWTTYEYSKETMRGGSALEEGSTGLNKDYALEWSYGKMETMTLLAARFYGGASSQRISKDTETFKVFRENGIASEEAPMYWGPQPFTGGPVYFGAVICFLFLLGAFVVKGTMRNWLLAGTILAILLSWGKNFTPLTDLFFYYFPMYNKFRVVSMMLIVAQLTVPMLGILGLHNIIAGKVSQKEVLRALKISVGALSGLLLFFILFGSGLFDFTALRDESYPKELQIALQNDRLAMMRADCIKALLLILFSGGAIWAFVKEKIGIYPLVGLIGVITLGDLWTVNQNYLRPDDYIRPKNLEEFLAPSEADKVILADTDPNFRVFSLDKNPALDGLTSYYHKSIGGYHGAKLSRYEDLINNQISNNNIAVLNMLNMRYVIGEDKKSKKPFAQMNPEALGNAWLVEEIMPVKGAKAEMDSLTNFNPRKTAVVDETIFGDYLKNLSVERNFMDTIRQTEYQPNYLKYQSKTTPETSFAVFSEIYYNGNKGWKAYIDGKEVPHIRVNYVLRGLKIPAGEHTVEFKFEPKSYYTGNKISLATSSLLLLLVVAAFVLPFMPFSRGDKKPEPAKEPDATTV
ncbi:MAG TPA: YfhO family protein [Chitinophagales bacterium]|nr:YfhO family protein [Chitinophagales bacterium]HRK29247.1 YfhO family protein [Chitinophagales bacterium]